MLEHGIDLFLLKLGTKGGGTVFKPGKVSVLAGTIALLATGCGAMPPTSNSRWMTIDQATQTVTLNVVAGYNSANAYANLDGFANGQLVFTVPQGYTVKLDFTNSSGIPADIGVYDKQGNLAFKGAGDSISSILENPTPGLLPGQSQTYKFVAGQVGSYRIDNLINRFPEFKNTQQDIGMWVELKVVPSGTPTVQTT